MNCDFVDAVLVQYEKLRTDYDGLKIVLAETEKPTRRDDYKFLFEQCEAYNFLIKSG